MCCLHTSRRIADLTTWLTWSHDFYPWTSRENRSRNRNGEASSKSTGARDSLTQKILAQLLALLLPE